MENPPIYILSVRTVDIYDFRLWPQSLESDYVHNHVVK